MASVNKRTWTHKGTKNEAWVVRYTDQGGKRRMKTFDKKKEADKYRTQVETEVEKGIHTPTSESTRLAAVAEQYLRAMELRSREGRQMGAPRLRRVRIITNKHIVPKLGGAPLGRTFI